MAIIEQETRAPAEVALPQVLDPRVVRGAELLDERLPGWADKIDLDTLNLLQADRCVLGQVGPCVFDENFYGTARRLIGADEMEWSEYGVWPDFLDGRADFKKLEQDWRLAILARQTA